MPSARSQHALAVRWRALAAQGVAVDVADVDRAGPLVQLAELVSVRLHALVPVGERVGVRQPLRHRQLVVRAVLEAVEARLQVEDRPAVLDRHDAPSAEAAPVPQPVDLVEDRHGRVARSQEVGVQRVDQADGVVDRAGGGDEGLPGDLAAEDTLAALVG